MCEILGMDQAMRPHSFLLTVYRPAKAWQPDCDNLDRKILCNEVVVLKNDHHMKTRARLGWAVFGKLDNIMLSKNIE